MEVNIMVIIRRVTRNSSWGGGLLQGSRGGTPSRRRPMEVWKSLPTAAGGKGVWGRAPSARRFLRFSTKI